MVSHMSSTSNTCSPNFARIVIRVSLISLNLARSRDSHLLFDISMKASRDSLQKVHHDVFCAYHALYRPNNCSCSSMYSALRFREVEPSHLGPILLAFFLVQIDLCDAGFWRCLMSEQLILVAPITEEMGDKPLTQYSDPFCRALLATRISLPDRPACLQEHLAGQG